MSLIPDEMVAYGMFMAAQEPLGREFERVLYANLRDLYAMSDENEVRQADRAEEQAVVKRVNDVITDLTAGKIGRSDRHNLGDALERANRNAGVQRAIR